MPLIEWRDQFNTGIAGVDHEHRQLIQLINDLHASLGGSGDRQAVDEFLGDIFAGISAHFALEESIMRERRYDQYDDHKADHDRLLDDIRDIMDDYEAGAYDRLDEVLAERLRNWFLRHFQTKDARLHKVLGDSHGR